MDDLATQKRSGSIEEWRYIASYWHAKQRFYFEKLSAIRPSIGATLKGLQIFHLGMGELERWLDKQTPEDP